MEVLGCMNTKEQIKKVGAPDNALTVHADGTVTRLVDHQNSDGTWGAHDEIVIDRNQLRRVQDRIISIATRLGHPFDVPISELQYGAPNIQQLKANLWPDYYVSMRGYLDTFGTE